MIAPPSFHVLRGPLARMLGWLLVVVLALLAVPAAFAGDRPDLDTFILTGPPDFTSSTTADFTFRSNAVGEHELWCKLDGEEYARCHDGRWRREGIAPGPHVFRVYAYEVQTGRVDETPASWEWVVEEAPPPLDAGSPGGDGGVPGGDAGSPDDDGGASESDAGMGGNDGGTSGEDAGTGDDPDAGQPGQEPPGDVTPPSSLDYLGGGMGCTGAPAPGALAGLMLLVLALHRRRGRG